LSIIPVTSIRDSRNAHYSARLDGVILGSVYAAAEKHGGGD
jgi:hypothetical protein